MFDVIKGDVEIYKLDDIDLQLQGNLYTEFGRNIKLVLHEYRSSISEGIEPHKKKFVPPTAIKIALCCNEAKNITLLNGIRISESGAKYRTDSIYSFGVAFIGEEFHHEEDIKFKEVEVNYPSLANWIGTERVKKCTPEHNIEIELYKNDDFTILASVVCLPGASTTLTGTNSTEERISQIVIQANKDGIPYNKYMRIISNVAFFLNLAEGKVVYPLNIKGNTSSNRDNIEIYYRMSNYPANFTQILDIDMIFTYNDIKNSISEILEKFFNFLDENKLLSDIISETFYYSDRSSIGPFALFVLLIEVFEGYDCEKARELKTYYDCKENNSKGLFCKVNRIFHKYEAITHSKLNISDITEDMKELSDMDGFVMFIVSLRDLLVHRAKDTRKKPEKKEIASEIARKVYDDSNVRVIDKINNKLLHIIRVLILNDTGMPYTAIEKEVKKYSEFVKNTRYLSSELESIQIKGGDA